MVDPDDHHLFVSLGCAAENLLQAALAHALMGHASFDATGSNALRLSRAAARAVNSTLFQAIPAQQSTGAEYDGKSLTKPELALLEKAGAASGVRIILLTGRQAMEKVLEFVVAGHTSQMQDRAFVAELKSWIRYSADEAVGSGEGLYAASSGNPSLPPWLGRRLFDLACTAKSENEKYAEHLRSSAGIAIFVADHIGPAQWIEVGRSYQCFALQSAALEICTAFLNQPLEVATLRPQLAAFSAIGAHRPDLVVRFGRGSKLPPSLRRPLQSVLV